MDSRVLLRLAAPLALTLVLVVAQALDLPAPVRWGSLAAMTLAWLWFAWTMARPGDASLVRDQGRLLEELRNFIGAEVQGSRDRKSTRLNSSHVKISYAVFCLKKKKKQRR